MWITQKTWAAFAEAERWTVALHGVGSGGIASHFPLVRLGEILEQRRERLTPRAWPDHLFSYLGLEHVESQSGALVNGKPVPGETIRSDSRVFREGDVLYGRLRPYLNKVFFAEGTVHTGICSSEFLVLVPDTTLVGGLFLRELLASEHVQSKVCKLQLGSALPRLHAKDLLAIEVPLPSLRIQKEIEAQLRHFQAEREVLRTKAKQLPMALRMALQRTLREGCEFDLGNEDPNQGPVWTNALPATYTPNTRGRGRPRSEAG
jgi:restriction endonuclease S subunit